MIKRIVNLVRNANRLVRFVLIRHRFAELHSGTLIKDMKMLTPKYISVGKGCIIWYNCRIEGVSQYNNIKYTPKIILEDGVRIQQNVHITCANYVKIGKNTCISANTTITDINHPYKEINIPIERQNLEVKNVNIGEDCKLYNGVVVLPGVTIGNHVCIGANSVVTHDIPDYCVAVGAPARIIKRYNFETSKWEMTDKNGYFINNLKNYI